MLFFVARTRGRAGGTPHWRPYAVGIAVIDWAGRTNETAAVKGDRLESKSKASADATKEYYMDATIKNRKTTDVTVTLPRAVVKKQTSPNQR